MTAQVTGTNGNCTVPAGAVGVAMNVTVANPTAPSFLTVFPADVARPNSSNLNWIASSPPTPNQVTVLLSATGAAKFFNYAGSVDVIADVVGYYDDHNFDDRYYTKAEVDSKLAVRPVSGFGQRAGVALYPAGVIEVAKLTDAGGSGPLTLAAGSRITMTGSVTIGNQAGTGEFSIMSCQLQLDDGGGFVSIGLPQGSESVGNNNHDESYNVALTAAVDRPAGNYVARITCAETFNSAASKPISRDAALTVVALPL